MTAAFDRPVRRHQPYDRPEVRDALQVCRQHQPTGDTCGGCGERYPCPPVRRARDTLRAAGVIE